MSERAQVRSEREGARGVDQSGARARGGADPLCDSPRMVAQRARIGAAFGAVAQKAGALEDEEPLQARMAGAQAATASVAAPNETGMPNQLKAGIEALSGMDLSDVRVHRNSGKPAQLNALAYAQGNDIHLGPGQEQHLPHEAWHVVQQRQGRVQETVQMAGVGVNDDRKLEKEADVMGERAATSVAQLVAGGKRKRNDLTPTTRQHGNSVAQRGTEENQVIKERQNAEAFDKIKAALGANTTTAVVRIAVRARSAKNKMWRWQSVGHSSVQLSVYTSNQSLHVQIGLDNGGSVKIEGNLYKSADTDKYDIILLEKPIEREAATKLVEGMHEEVGKTHSYCEWMFPSWETLGYENCATWALKMGSEAGISVPSTLKSSAGVLPDPASLAERIRGGDAKSGEVKDLKHGSNQDHQIGKPNVADVILGDTTSDVDAGKWAAVAAILEARDARRGDPTLKDLEYCFTAHANAEEQKKAYTKAIELADQVRTRAEEMREDRQSSKSGSTIGVGAVAGAGAAMAIGGGMFYLWTHSRGR